MAQVPAWKLLEVPASVWRGRTVLIGVTAPALGDLQETPVGPMGGTEIQAVALANVLENRGLRPLPLWGDGLLLLGWGTLAGLVLRRPASSGRTLQVALALVAVALLAGGALWSAAQLTMPLAALVLAAVAGGGARAAGQALVEGRERAYLTRCCVSACPPPCCATSCAARVRSGTRRWAAAPAARCCSATWWRSRP